MYLCIFSHSIKSLWFNIPAQIILYKLHKSFDICALENCAINLLGLIYFARWRILNLNHLKYFWYDMSEQFKVFMLTVIMLLVFFCTSFSIDRLCVDINNLWCYYVFESWAVNCTMEKSYYDVNIVVVWLLFTYTH